MTGVTPEIGGSQVSVHALTQLAQRWFTRKRFEQAKELLDLCLSDRPTAGPALELRGRCWVQLGQPQRALPDFDLALKLRKSFTRYSRRGHARFLCKDYSGALADFEAALERQPDNADTLSNRAGVFKMLGRADEALSDCDRALTIDPNNLSALNNRGVLRRQRGDHAGAYADFSRVIEREPGHAMGRSHRGLMSRMLGDMGSARADLEQAVAIDPELSSARFNLSLIDLLEGRWLPGWENYERRYRRYGKPLPAPGGTLWDGGSLDGRSLLLVCEQGFGDTLHFIRFVRELSALGEISVQLIHPLHELLTSQFPEVARWSQLGEPPPPHDLYLPLLSVPHRLGLTEERIPAEVPYLRADPQRVERMREALQPDRGRLIGVVWQGNPQNDNDSLRSAPLAALAPLADVPGVRLLSLQAKAGVEQIATAPFTLEQLPEWADRDAPFCDTAAALMLCDRLVSIDSAAVHLAGALGVPVTLAACASPDWRWMLDREDSPWYPTMHIARQRSLHDWDELMQRIAASL